MSNENSTFSRLTDRGFSSSLFLISLIIGAIFYIDLSTPLGVAGGVLYVAPILIASYFLHERQLILLAFGCLLLTIFGWISSPITETPDWKVISNRIIALLVILVATILMMHRNRLLAKREEALERIRVLEGILPICVECKKIRDDTNNWHQLESYITDNSEAMFTHGCCPECKEQAMQRIERQFQNMEIS